jgi:hypothetical protein
MAEANCTMPVVTCMKENSLMIWLKDLAFTNTQTEASTSVTGIKTNNTDLERKSGMTQACTRDFIKMQVRKAKVSTAGQMETATSESGTRICLMAPACSSGMTRDYILGTGKTT